MADMPDFSGMTAEEIQMFDERLKQERISRHKRHVSEAKEKVKAILAEYNLALSDLFPGKVNGLSHAKYRNPDNLDQVWGGAGRRPAWLNALIEKGEKEGKSTKAVLEECASDL